MHNVLNVCYNSLVLVMVAYDIEYFNVCCWLVIEFDEKINSVS